MAHELLPLALMVERHASGAYYWVLLEAMDDAGEFIRLVEGGQHFAAYEAALQNGCDALLRLLPDPDAGPSAGPSTGPAA
ncbi:MAG: hypothetical protein V4505_21120 [Pseudomonadota bacterium]